MLPLSGSIWRVGRPIVRLARTKYAQRVSVGVRTSESSANRWHGIPSARASRATVGGAGPSSEPYDPYRAAHLQRSRKPTTHSSMSCKRTVSVIPTGRLAKRIAKLPPKRDLAWRKSLATRRPLLRQHAFQHAPRHAPRGLSRSDHVRGSCSSIASTSGRLSLTRTFTTPKTGNITCVIHAAKALACSACSATC